MSLNFNAELAEEINSLRTNPKRYSYKLREYTKYFKGKVLRLPGSNAGIRTEEGADAYNEAADFLETQNRIEAFEVSKGLCKIAQEFLSEIQRRDPDDLGNIDMEEIIAKYGNYYGNFSRAIDFGGETPEQALTNLIVSDGDPSRGQRDSLLSTDLSSVGVANGTHASYRHCTVIVSCTKFENTVDKDDREDFSTSYESVNNEEKQPKNQGGNEGRTLKPRKVVLREGEDNRREPQYNQGNNQGNKGYNQGYNQGNKGYNQGNNQGYEEGGNDEDELPPGCVSVSKSEKIVVENGKKKKITKITRVMEDGTKEIETIKDTVDE